MKRKHIARTGAGALCALLAAALLAAQRFYSGSFGDQYAAERWESGEKRYSQVTCFISNDESCGYDDVMEINESIEDALAEGAAEGRWLSSYSMEAKVTVSAGSKTVRARAICTGGDFFLFHPLDMISGWTYKEDALSGDAVVLDMRLAWSLFGGYELKGKTVEIGGWKCLIAGVSRPPRRGAAGEAYGEEPTVYLPYNLAYRTGADKAINCYEAVLPNPVSGYALGILEDALDFSEGNYELMENTGRFGFLKSLKRAGGLSGLARKDSPVYYPYWENAARSGEIICSVLAASAAALAVYPLLLIALYLIKLIKFLRRSKNVETIC